MNEFVKKQWEDFCRNLERSAKHLAGDDEQLIEQFLDSAADFYDSANPDSFQELLQAIADGTELAIKWQGQSPICIDSSDSDPKVEMKMTYTEAENHAPMPMPTETMAEQAEQARSNS